MNKIIFCWEWRINIYKCMYILKYCFYILWLERVENSLRKYVPRLSVSNNTHIIDIKSSIANQTILASGSLGCIAFCQSHGPLEITFLPTFRLLIGLLLTVRDEAFTYCSNRTQHKHIVCTHLFYYQSYFVTFSCILRSQIPVPQTL